MNVNIKRARLIEFDWPDYRGQPTTPRITAMRNARGDAFDFLAIDGVVVGDEYSDCVREDDIAVGGKNIVVFDQLPVTLADLLPEGCTAFRFQERPSGPCYYAGVVEQGIWECTSFTDSFASRGELEGTLVDNGLLDYGTVVPLSPHPQYVEERR